MANKDLLRFHIRTGIAVVVLGALIVLGAALWCTPLRAWAYDVSGEESLVPQIKGAVQYASNLVRPQPRLGRDPGLTQHAGVNPLGINTFLEQEVEVAKRERSLQMIGEAGFGWLEVIAHVPGMTFVLM